MKAGLDYSFLPSTKLLKKVFMLDKNIYTFDFCKLIIHQRTNSKSTILFVDSNNVELSPTSYIG